MEVAGVDTQKGMMQVLRNLNGKGHFVKLLEIEGSEIRCNGIDKVSDWKIHKQLTPQNN